MRAVTVGFMLALATAPGFAQSSKDRIDAVRHMRLGQENLRAELYDKAEAEFRSAIKLDSRLELAHYGLGQVYMATKRYADAVVAYTNCREAFHQNASREATGQLEDERRRDDQLRDLEDQKMLLQSGRIKVLDLSAQIQKVDMMIREIKNRRYQQMDGPAPTPTWISVALGSAYFRRGSVEDAEREYREALKVDPKLGEAHNNLAVICMQSGRLDEADIEIRLAEKAGVRVNPALKEDIKNRRK
jgi:tetratricopeptide (TPR) repeat protein